MSMSDFAEAHHRNGLAWLELKDWARAADCFRQAAAARPSFAAAYSNWGLALHAASRRAEAAALFEQAGELEPNNPQFALNAAVTFHQLNELDRAVAAYRRVLSACPSHTESARNLAIILKEQGRFDESIRALRALLQFEPDHALAYYTLGEFASEGHYQFTTDELRRIRALIASESTPALERSFCCFALASVLNRQGAYDEAFGYYQRANELHRGILQEKNQAFDARIYEAFVDRIIATQDAGFFQRTRDWGIATDLPVFIVGMPRSGSTLVEQILASHPRVFGAGETGAVPEFFTHWVQATFPEPPLPPGPSTARERAVDFLQRAQILGKGSDRVTLKSLENYLHLGAIATLFPGVRVIHCRRDPLDVCLSCYFQNFTHVTFAWSLEDIGGCYRCYEKLMGHWQRVLPVNVHEVRYEDLVHNQEAVTRRLLDYCGLEWDERCLAFFKTPRAVHTASALQVRKPISTSAIGRWKRYRSHLGPLFRALGCSVPGSVPLPAAAAAASAPPVSQDANYGALASFAM